MAPERLSEVLAPLTVEDFLSSVWGKKYWHGPGESARFADLLPWADLNAILRHQKLDSPRLRLMREGEPIPADSFTSYHLSRRQPAQRIPTLRAPELTRHLSEGATLILDSVDELHEPVTRLAENLERTLRTRIQVNMYAGWRTSRGFDLHWDDHDVFILQVAGRKHWKIYGMTREYPLRRDAETDTNPPETPLWEGMLEQGALLYIPRGWWHVALPLDEPTLHLTVGLHNSTGADFFAWYADRLRVNTAVRQDLPALASAAEQSAHLNRLQAAWAEAWKPELLTEYLAGLDSRTQPRPAFGLPWTATPDALPAGNARVKWIVPRPVTWSESDGAVRASCRGKEWTFAAAALPLLEALEQGGSATVDELAAFGLDRETVRAFVSELLDGGLVALCPKDA